MRTLLLWCPDWPVIAAGIAEGVSVHRPVAVLHANRVLACSPAARVEGVRRGLRKHQAQRRCPQLVVLAHDPGRDARAFEPVVAAVEQLAPGVEIVRPGVCALAARGPSGYYGTEAAAAERLVEHVALTCGVEIQAGIAEGVFAATLAARAGRVIPPGGTPAFLADLDITTLDRPHLTDLLRRLGLRTLADFAALPAGDVMARLGFDAAYAHRLASGQQERPLAVRTPPPDLVVTGHYDPPLERVDLAAFAARSLAEQLHERLAGHGMAATRLGIEARTGAGEELHRMWRHEGLLAAGDLADRVRWQLDGWLTGVGRTRPTAGIDLIRLVPDGVVRHTGMQPGLWGEVGVADERAHRALVRVQGLLGPDSVYTAVIGGGRGYAERVTLVPWGDPRVPSTPGAAASQPPVSTGDRSGRPPWPGRLPAPAPAVVLAEPTPMEVRTADGAPLVVDDRLAMTGAPASVQLVPSSTVDSSAPAARLPAPAPASASASASTSAEVTGWAGPWPVEERWWAPGEVNRLVRFQLTLADGRALLAGYRSGRWSVEAWYD